jgi:N-acetylglucosamine kinase-like BadF-type ATPase
VAEKFYLGLDSGGTKTEVVIAAVDGSFVTNCFGGPIQMHSRRAKPKDVAMAEGFVEQALSQAKLAWNNIAFFGFGMSGIDFDDEIPLQTRTLLAGLRIDPSRARVVNDGVVALWGGSAAKRAVILQLGTAYTAAWRRGLGTEQPFDHLNAGVLVEVRRLILANCARAWDGRLPPSILPELILEHFEIKDPLKLVKLGIRNKLDRWKLLTVIDPWRQALERGDRLSRAIADEAAKVYAHDLNVLIDRAGGDGADVVLGGGLLRHGPEYLRDRIAALVAKKHPKCRAHLPHLAPAVGAAVMAAYHDGADHAAFFRRAQKTAPPMMM